MDGNLQIEINYIEQAISKLVNDCKNNVKIDPSFLVTFLEPSVDKISNLSDEELCSSGGQAVEIHHALMPQYFILKECAKQLSEVDSFTSTLINKVAEKIGNIPYRIYSYYYDLTFDYINNLEQTDRSYDDSFISILKEINGLNDVLDRIKKRIFNMNPNDLYNNGELTNLFFLTLNALSFLAKCGYPNLDIIFSNFSDKYVKKH